MTQLLRLHYDFGHISFKKLREMAKQGIIPKNLINQPPPVCSACAYAKAHKKPWRSKPSKKFDSNEAPTVPGQVISVDMLVSPIPGLIAQMTGFITKQRYRYATVYVDQATGYGYVYLQQTASAGETLEGKKAFERLSSSHSISILAYHAVNGIFKAIEWVQACNVKNQKLTFAAVGAHHQNGKAERRIREIQDMARTMLLHAHKRWPQAITAHLWPYAVRHASNCINSTSNMQHPSRQSPEQLFGKTKVQLKTKHWKPFGCPVYVLEETLQTNKLCNKWQERARIGIYLGQSPIHNRNVALVLNRHTGHMSPQFHVQFDKSFDTMQQTKVDCTWQKQTFFTSTEKADTVPAWDAQDKFKRNSQK